VPFVLSALVVTLVALLVVLAVHRFIAAHFRPL